MKAQVFRHVYGGLSHVPIGTDRMKVYDLKWGKAGEFETLQDAIKDMKAKGVIEFVNNEERSQVAHKLSWYDADGSFVWFDEEGEGR